MARTRSRRAPGYVALSVLAIIILVCLFFFRRPASTAGSLDLPLDTWRYGSNGEKPNMQSIAAWSRRIDVRNRIASFWTTLASDLTASAPPNARPRRIPSPPNPSLPGANLYAIDMTGDEIEQMRVAHEKFVTLAGKIPSQGLFIPGSRGIVTTAGGKYIPIFLVTLRLLRRTGSNLPVEVFLADDSEWNEQLCEHELPKHNAACRVLSHVLDTAQHEPIKMYQYKVFAMLFSSFEDVIFIDADSAPAVDPEMLLDEGPYKEDGMVLWPDFWPATVSPVFRKIQGREGKAVSEKTAETGELLLSKRLHWATLLLSVYYNYFGPELYYSILSQGAPGEGDKETFSAAADFYDKPYYRVPHGVGALGWFDREHNNDFRGVAMIQADPRVNDTKRPAFIHANFPKLDPFNLLHTGQTKWQDGQEHRIWAMSPEQAAMVSWDSDPERAAFEEMIFVACRWHHLVQPEVSLEKAQAECSSLQQHYVRLFGAKHPPHEGKH